MRRELEKGEGPGSADFQTRADTALAPAQKSDRHRVRVSIIGPRGIPDIIGGIETQCELIYPALKAMEPDWKITLFGRKTYMKPGLTSFKGVRLQQLWSPKISGFETFAHAFLCLLYARFRMKTDIVHLHGIGSAIWSPLARLLGLTVVVTHHAPDFERPKWGVVGRSALKWGEWMAAHSASRVICVSHAVEDDFLARHPHAAGRSMVITNALRALPEDADAAHKILDELGLQSGQYILAVGRLEETKRFQDLIAAMPKEGSRKLVIAGSPIDSEGHAQELLARAGPNIIFAGFRTGSELAALYRNCGLFIHPSAMEGCGLVVLEALSFGAPTVLSDIPPHREFGLPDHAYFQVGDIDAIRALLQTPDLKNLYIKASEKIAKSYDLEEATLRHRMVFQSLIDSR